MMKKQKLDDSVYDKEKVGVEDEQEKRRYRSMAKVAIGSGINPSVENSVIFRINPHSLPEFYPRYFETRAYDSGDVRRRSRNC
ncbi:unnamed protein product [Arabis nemorensis]|uniref:Uncharacterized protein n=1 Tax=Arabis nemorensis TaxID=586526 RepID=A0A565B8J0_9BRAS|nr:unnamed protein product [Arabis nemorensis]